MHLKTLGDTEHNEPERWSVDFYEEFLPEFRHLSEAVRRETFSLIELLAAFGPRLGRPQVDTLKGSKHPNMKELRFRAGGGIWRIAFAFDVKRRAILFVAGNKSGVSQEKFYRSLIGIADARFERHQTKIALETKN